jgi:hypothetical protein
MTMNSPSNQELPAGRLLRRADAAAYIRERFAIPCSRQTLAKYAVTGEGPMYRLAGRFPIYVAQDLDAWALSRLSAPVRSTSAAQRG